LALKYPGDPSILDTVIWGLVFATPMLAIFLPMIGLTAGAITYFIMRRRYDRRKSN
jgi:uncharacterized membrane protein YdjX (TVP38/TMEM64 family)